MPRRLLLTRRRIFSLHAARCGRSSRPWRSTGLRGPPLGACPAPTPSSMARDECRLPRRQTCSTVSIQLVTAKRAVSASSSPRPAEVRPPASRAVEGSDARLPPADLEVAEVVAGRRHPRAPVLLLGGPDQRAEMLHDLLGSMKRRKARRALQILEESRGSAGTIRCRRRARRGRNYLKCVVLPRWFDQSPSPRISAAFLGMV